jgi:hypothetical protein
MARVVDVVHTVISTYIQLGNEKHIVSHPAKILIFDDGTTAWACLFCDKAATDGYRLGLFDGVEERVDVQMPSMAHGLPWACRTCAGEHLAAVPLGIGSAITPGCTGRPCQELNQVDHTLSIIRPIGAFIWIDERI